MSRRFASHLLCPIFVYAGEPERPTFPAPNKPNGKVLVSVGWFLSLLWRVEQSRPTPVCSMYSFYNPLLKCFISCSELWSTEYMAVWNSCVGCYSSTNIGREHAVFRLFIRPSGWPLTINTYSKWRIISVFSGGISMKLGKNIHHVSGYCLSLIHIWRCRRRG